MCQCHFVVIVMPVPFLVWFPVILSYVQKDATTPNMVGSTMSEDVAFVLVMVCKRMQQLPTMLGPAVHRGKDTTHEAFFKHLNSILARAWPYQYRKSWANWFNIVALRFDDLGTKEILGVVRCKVWLVSNFALQHAKEVCKRTQHVTPNNVASVCTGLCGACFLLLKSL